MSLKIYVKIDSLLKIVSDYIEFSVCYWKRWIMDSAHLVSFWHVFLYACVGEIWKELSHNFSVYSIKMYYCSTTVLLDMETSKWDNALETMSKIHCIVITKYIWFTTFQENTFSRFILWNIIVLYMSIKHIYISTYPLVHFLDQGRIIQ